MTTATATTTQPAERTYRARDLSTVTLRYHVDAQGRHVVTVFWPAGMDICPDYYRLPTVELAREKWAALRRHIARRGFN